MSTVRSPITRMLGVPALALSLTFGLAACGDDPESAVTLEDINEEGAEDLGGVQSLEDEVSEEDIANAPEEESETALFDATPGTPVTVEGKIVEVLNPQAFVIGQGDRATLVVRPVPDGVALLPGYTAQVTGTVGTFVLLEVEAELQADLRDAEFEVFEGGPYVAAVDVNLLDED
ncbi:hypothetical protein ACI8AC_07320 [Geodermatophilus sp. SYSU D00758]